MNISQRDTTTTTSTGQPVEGLKQVQRIQGLPLETQQRFEGQPQSFEGQQQRFEGQPQSFEGQQQRFEGQPQSFEGQQQGFEGQPQRFEGQQQPFPGQQQQLFEGQQQGSEQQGLQQPYGQTSTGQGQNLPAIPLAPGQSPTELPGSRVIKEWTIVPAESLPSDLPPAPPGFRVVQYERDVEIDLSKLALGPTPLTTPYTTTTGLYTTTGLSTDVCAPINVCAPTTVCTPIDVCAPMYRTTMYETLKPEIRVETTTNPSIPLETTVREFPGGEVVKAKGPHGEKITTTVTRLPDGGERVETKVKEPIGPRHTPEDVITKTFIREPCGPSTTVETTSHIVAPEPVLEETIHHVGHEEAPRKGKLGHHHHDTSLGGLLKGAFGLKHGEHTPKETM